MDERMNCSNFNQLNNVLYFTETLNQTRLGSGMNVFSTYSNVMFLVFSPVLESKTIVSFLKDKRPKKYYKLKVNCLINTTLIVRKLISRIILE